MKTSEREKYWREVVSRQEKSGLAVRPFCRQEGLCAHTLYGWRQRLAKSSGRVNFTAVDIRPETMQPSHPLELILSGGERLRIPSGIDEATLRTVLLALRERT
jgi:transposase-like protein